MSTDSNGGTEPRTILVYCKWCHKTHAASIWEQPCGDDYRNWIEESTGLDWTQVLRIEQGEFSGV